MQDRALDHALEAEGGLSIDVLAADHRGMFVDELREELAQFLDIRRAGAQDFRRRRIVQHGEQQVLHGNEFVALLPRFHERHVQTDFELLRNHVSSITH